MKQKNKISKVRELKTKSEGFIDGAKFVLGFRDFADSWCFTKIRDINERVDVMMRHTSPKRYINPKNRSLITLFEEMTLLAIRSEGYYEALIESIEGTKKKYAGTKSEKDRDGLYAQILKDFNELHQNLCYNLALMKPWGERQ